MDKKTLGVMSYAKTQLGLEVEIIGEWLWITNYTSKQVQDLRKIGFRFSKDKNAWFYYSKPTEKKTKYLYSLDQLRDIYNNPGLVTTAK